MLDPTRKMIVDVHQDVDDLTVIHLEVEAGICVDVFEPL